MQASGTPFPDWKESFQPVVRLLTSQYCERGVAGAAAGERCAELMQEPHCSSLIAARTRCALVARLPLTQGLTFKIEGAARVESSCDPAWGA